MITNLRKYFPFVGFGFSLVDPMFDVKLWWVKALILVIFISLTMFFIGEDNLNVPRSVRIRVAIIGGLIGAVVAVLANLNIWL